MVSRRPFGYYYTIFKQALLLSLLLVLYLVNSDSFDSSSFGALLSSEAFVIAAVACLAFSVLILPSLTVDIALGSLSRFKLTFFFDFCCLIPDYCL